MNHLQEVTQLSNTYYALRHGRSLANREELIISHPDDGVPHYGLSNEGREQVARAVEEAREKHALDHSTLIVSSDFARARETAEIAARLLGVPEIITTPQLRERFFGAWDKQHHSNYHHVWSDDFTNPDHKNYGVESTSEVLSRTTALIRDLEDTYSGRNVLLISHGDALQILQTAFERVASSHHRLLAHLETGEIRKLRLKARDEIL
jgi:probable phosphoglycerate mutase